jgi:outer membrane protein OmpA-like peptidoglycan-associated protein
MTKNSFQAIAAAAAWSIALSLVSMGGALAQQTPPCPSTTTIQTVRNFGAFSHDVHLLPADQRAALDQVAKRILLSFSSPGCTPLSVVLVEGYSDIVRDHPEWSDAQRIGREDTVSQERAAAVRDYLLTSVEANMPGISARIRFLVPVGYGRLDADPSKVAENRRVVVTTGALAIPPPGAKPSLDERAKRAQDLARRNGLGPMDCALSLFSRRNSAGVSLFYVDAQKPITVVKGLAPISLLWQGTDCGDTWPRLCREMNYGSLSVDEKLAFSTNLVEDLKSTRFDPQRPDQEILDRLKEITTNAIEANRVINAHLRRLNTDLSKPDVARVQLNAWQQAGARDPNDIHSCFFKE